MGRKKGNVLQNEITLKQYRDVKGRGRLFPSKMTTAKIEKKLAQIKHFKQVEKMQLEKTRTLLERAGFIEREKGSGILSHPTHGEINLHSIKKREMEIINKIKRQLKDERIDAVKKVRYPTQIKITDAVKILRAAGYREIEPGHWFNAKRGGQASIKFSIAVKEIQDRTTNKILWQLKEELGLKI